MTHISYNYIYNMSKEEDFIKVMVRIKEPKKECSFEYSDKKGTIQCSKNAYQFDHIFSHQSSNEDIFRHVGLELVENVLNGFNSCIFLYGQTGTGKTHTMTGSNNQQGLVQKSVKYLIKRLEYKNQIQNYSLKVSYFELYNEKIKDLLSDKLTIVQIRESKLGFNVEGLVQKSIQSYEYFEKFLNKGLSNRNTRYTLMNKQSSRSHSILTIFVQYTLKSKKGVIITSSKLNFVDLAGSQKQKQTKATGDMIKQAASINKSLTVLNNVIFKLGDKKSKQLVHIPYRDSILTKVLKDSLGGNAKTIIIGTISADEVQICETISTLLFLERAKKVKNQLQKNIKVEGNEQNLNEQIIGCKERIQQYENTIVTLRKQLQESKKQNEQKSLEIQQLHQLIKTLKNPQSFFSEFFSIQSASQDGTDRFKFQNSQNSSLPMIMEENEHQLSELPIKIQNKQYCTKSDIFKNNYLRSIKQPSFSQDLQKNIEDFSCKQCLFLASQIQKYYEQDQKFSGLLKKIEENMDNLHFDQAQLNILAVEHQKLVATQAHLERYRAELSKTTQENNINNKKCREMEIKSISQKCSNGMVELGLKKNMEDIKSQCNNKIRSLKNDISQELNFLRSRQVELFEQNKYLFNANCQLNIKVEELELYLNMKEKLIMEMRQNKAHSSISDKPQIEEENLTLRAYIKQLQEQIERNLREYTNQQQKSQDDIKRYKQQIQLIKISIQVSEDKCDEALQSLERAQIELKEKDKQIENIALKLKEEKNNLTEVIEQYVAIQHKSSQLQIELEFAQYNFKQQCSQLQNLKYQISSHQDSENYMKEEIYQKDKQIERLKQEISQNQNIEAIMDKLSSISFQTGFYYPADKDKDQVESIFKKQIEDLKTQINYHKQKEQDYKKRLCQNKKIVSENFQKMQKILQTYKYQIDLERKKYAKIFDENKFLHRRINTQQNTIKTLKIQKRAQNNGNGGYS